MINDPKEGVNNPIVDLLKMKQSEILFLLLLWLLGLILWLMAGSMEEHNYGKIWIDAARDISIFFFSISTIDVIKESLFKREVAREKAELLAQSTERFESIIDARNNISANGLRQLYQGLETAKIKEIITDLQPGDKLYCHNSFISQSDNLKSIILEKAQNDVEFHFLMLAPYCNNAQRRAKEIDQDPIVYSNNCQQFIKNIESIISKLSAKNPDFERKIQIRKYRSLASIPFFLIEREGVLKSAYTGIHLCQKSESSMYLYWEKEPNQEMPVFLNVLLQYWKFKWLEGHEEYQNSKVWEGNWTYNSFDENNSNQLAVYSGECKIEESVGNFIANGRRTKTKSEISNIAWRSDSIHRYEYKGTQKLIMSHKIYPQTGEYAEKGIQAFVMLTSTSPDELKGEYHVAGYGNSLDPEICTSKAGKIIFQRVDSHRC